MRIKIEFTAEEKQNIINIASTTGAVQADKDEHLVGNFGEFKYNSTENVMVFDFKSGFITATSQLMASCVNMIKSLVTTCNMYSDFWLKDTRDLLKETKEKEDVADAKKAAAATPLYDDDYNNY